MTSATFLNPGGLAEPGFLSLVAKPTGTTFAAVAVSSNLGYPLSWAPPTNFIRYDKVGDLGALGGTTNTYVRRGVQWRRLRRRALGDELETKGIWGAG